MDPIATKMLLQIIQKEKERGASILMSTHVLDTAEKICDSFILINSGNQLATGTLEQLREKCGLSQSSLFDCYHQLVEGVYDE